jgi:hypothetical protein
MAFRAALFQSVTTSARAVRTLAAHMSIVTIATAGFLFMASIPKSKW